MVFVCRVGKKGGGGEEVIPVLPEIVERPVL